MTGRVAVQLHQGALTPVRVVAGDGPHHGPDMTVQYFADNFKSWLAHGRKEPKTRKTCHQNIGLVPDGLSPLDHAGVKLERLPHPAPEPAAQPDILTRAAPRVSLQSHSP